MNSIDNPVKPVFDQFYMQSYIAICISITWIDFEMPNQKIPTQNAHWWSGV